FMDGTGAVRVELVSASRAILGCSPIARGFNSLLFRGEPLALRPRGALVGLGLLLVSLKLTELGPPAVFFGLTAPILGSCLGPPPGHEHGADHNQEANDNDGNDDRGVHRTSRSRTVVVRLPLTA